MTDIPHFALPFHWGANGHAAVVEQDAPTDVASCVATLCMTPLGWRPEQIEYGLQDLVFALDLQDSALVAVVNRWEPRATPMQQQVESADLLTRLVNLVLEVNQ